MNSSIGDDDPRLNIEGYDFIRYDLPSVSERVGVCLYYKSYLPLVQRPELTFLDECVVCEIKLGTNNLIFSLLYRSPSQNPDQFDQFKDKWEETIKSIVNCSPSVLVFLGDFNARNSDWWSGDITNPKEQELNEIASQYDLHQLIDRPTHILQNSSSCIDLIFTSNQANVAEFGFFWIFF